ncbi:hybrid sensor histidine kinase/response regulator [Ramlibacter sp.]|uniref:hybrid sensor histidine kinase/response regulator n=1 Tax=Ramlibacter sp. TaxID=1917967 RepID=UPI002FCB13D4
MPSLDPHFDRKLAAIFQAEAVEHVRRMEVCLAQLEQAGGGNEAGQPLEALFRSAHSLKGAARAVGEHLVESVCHAAENLLAGVQRGRLAWSMELADALQDTVAALARVLVERTGPPGAMAELLPRLERLEQDGPLPAPATAAPETPASTPAPPPPAATEAPHFEPTVRIGVERLARLLYQVEELAAAKAGAAQQLAQLEAALASSDRFRSRWGASHPEAVQDWDQHQSQLRALQAQARQEQRQWAGTVDALLANVKATLLLPIGSMHPFLVATVRELARSQGKEVELRMSGQAVEIDRRLLEELRGPLVHLLRNAIDHGIEPPAQRLAGGKSARGLVELRVLARSGGRVELTVADDGAGIDATRLAQAAKDLDLPLPEEQDPDALLTLVFNSGISTSDQLTRVSGRGLGLSIVRETIERLGGTVSIRSQAGQGTSFVIVLMPSLATYRAVEVEVAGRSLLVPTQRIERCLRLAPDAPRRLGARQVLPLGDADLPLVSLAALLGLPAAADPPERLACLVLVAGHQRLAVTMDAIGGEQEVLGKPIDAAAGRTPMVIGAAVVRPGCLAPILNVPELVRMALTGTASAEPARIQARRQGRSVLLAEDSITSRTLLKNILELAGHSVEVAVDGAQALEKLRAGRFDVVVSDIEMPRLDGIGLTRAIRRDPAFAHLPVVLVTSLGSPADRERGADAGANAYIVKRGFDQGNLLQAITELA